MLMSLLARWARNESANVAMIFGLSAPVILLGTGIAVDYSLYARDKARLNMIADEAALSMVSSSGMQLTTAAATTFAVNLFNAQAAQVPQIKMKSDTSCPTQPAPPCVTVTTAAATNVRSATVSYSVTYNVLFPTVFSSVIGVSSLPISGSASAQSASASALNTNYYVLLDNQGSMLLPDSSAGITKMQQLTPTQNSNHGCAFACHAAAPSSPPPPWGQDMQGNPCQPGTSGRNCPVIDNYQVAVNNGVTLRYNDVLTAMTDVINDAQSAQNAAVSPPTYQFSVYSVDSPTTEGLYNIMPLTANYQSGWTANSSKFQPYEVYADGGACQANSAGPCGTYANIGQPAGTTIYPAYDVGFFSSPMGTEMSTLANTIPAAGSGLTGSTPKEVLLIVTDGVEDTVVSNNLSITVWDSNALNACQTLKNKGVEIAILYTTYYPTPGFWLYDDYVGTFINQIPTTLAACATPGLFLTAGVDDNIPRELQTLFQLTQQTPKLTQ